MALAAQLAAPAVWSHYATLLFLEGWCARSGYGSIAPDAPQHVRATHSHICNAILLVMLCERIVMRRTIFLLWHASYPLLSYRLGTAQTGKEGFGRFALSEVVDEAVPVIEPLLPCSRYNSGPSVFNCVHSHHCMIPPQRKNAGSRNVSSTLNIKEDSLSFRVHAEYSPLAPL